MRNAEQNEIIGAFIDLLAGPTGDGGNKRAAGLKPLWKVDPSHQAALLRHLDRVLAGEKVDPDSGCSGWAHIGWRALALAWQQTNQGESFDVV